MTAKILELADRYLAEYMEKIQCAVASLPDEALWWRANERSNSIGNLMLHLEGNLSQWILGGLVGEPIERRRGAEFAARDEMPKERLLARLAETVARCRFGLPRLPLVELERQREIQTYTVDGHAALFHAVEHMSYHTGQIVLLAKQLLPVGKELEFYPQHQDE